MKQGINSRITTSLEPTSSTSPSIQSNNQLIEAEQKGNVNNNQSTDSISQANDFLGMSPLFFNTDECTSIWYADKPPHLGGIPRKISVDELNNKIGKGFTFTENIYVNNKLKINSKHLHNKNYMKDELLKMINNPFSDKLVVCDMGEEVGHGVFARAAIQVGEIVAVYSGELKIKGQRTQYGMDVDPESNYIIDATNYGGIARFFQHLPLNIAQNFKQLVPVLQKDKKLLKRYLELVMAGDNLTRSQKEHGISVTMNDIVHNDGKGTFRDFLYYGKTEWELQRLQFLEISVNKVASENLVTEFSTIDGKPIAYLWAGRNIEPHEQLGFDYGIGYWRDRATLPLLFNLAGEVIPQTSYRYSSLPFFVKELASKNADIAFNI